MKLQKSKQSVVAIESVEATEPQQKALTLQEIEHRRAQEQKLTRGQRIADSMAAKVGSWAFLIGQSTFLAGWVVMNSIPGLPHWDEQPYILLNLMFSFASAYTAPIVLMSQNRQSDAEREKAEYDHQVNLKAGYDIELLHEKMDKLQAQQIQELTMVVKEQQRYLNEMKASVLPALQAQQQAIQEIKVEVLPTLQHSSALNEIKVADGKLPNGYSVYFPLNTDAVTEKCPDAQVN
jgi:uncharacterized membrane protein